jgi:hypothetical protein
VRWRACGSRSAPPGGNARDPRAAEPFKHPVGTGSVSAAAAAPSRSRPAPQCPRVIARRSRWTRKRPSSSRARLRGGAWPARLVICLGWLGWCAGDGLGVALGAGIERTRPTAHSARRGAARRAVGTLGLGLAAATSRFGAAGVKWRSGAGGSAFEFALDACVGLVACCGSGGVTPGRFVVGGSACAFAVEGSDGRAAPGGSAGVACGIRLRRLGRRGRDALLDRRWRLGWRRRPWRLGRRSLPGDDRDSCLIGVLRLIALVDTEAPLPPPGAAIGGRGRVWLRGSLGGHARGSRVAESAGPEPAGRWGAVAVGLPASRPARRPRSRVRRFGHERSLGDGGTAGRRDGGTAATTARRG